MPNRRKAHDELVDALLLELGRHPEFGNFWDQKTGFVISEKGYAIYYGLDGSADVSGILCCGCRCELECKTGSAKLQKNQRNFKVMILKNRGFHQTVRAIPDTLEAIEVHIKKCPKGVLTTLEGVCKKVNLY